MANIVMIIKGTILNAAAFTGSNYLAKYLSGSNGKATLNEKTWQACQAAMAKYTHDRTKLLDWIKTNREIKEQTKQNFTSTDYAFKLYNQISKSLLTKNPSSLTSINQVSFRNRTSCSLLVAVPSHAAMWLFVLFKVSQV